MTAINQHSIANRSSLDDATQTAADRTIGNDAHARKLSDNGAQDINSGTIRISFNAHMRLRAYQDQHASADPELMSRQLPQVELDKPDDRSANMLRPTTQAGFSTRVSQVLSEIEQNIVHSSEPGYRYLVNMLSSNKSAIADPQQLEEIMRKEEFYLSRRKPFMDSTDFQSYSQVLSQFTNIIQRQQYSS